MDSTAWLIPLKDLDPDARAIHLGAVAELELAPGQTDFVGDPLRMVMAALEDGTRHPHVIEGGGAAVGVLTLQRGAATLAGWADDDTAWLLRGFLIDRRMQGKGLGTAAAMAAVTAARQLTRRSGSGELGVVLSVNSRNTAGMSAYLRAGFADVGEYLGGRAGPQRIMYQPF
ncbi:GNAT family N-acetyltransferase [Pseudarthrobacter sp. J64]|uniref:GNAT family N-acetyltransferase n=1 Tax=Pseudarthrobacter sp. J64 TaxID=3116485 RepID=UPI002E80FF04|nr:GNAT family N-acetyltransferase [Pseudarthrobacter sp. J64]MEE2569632.1 GNAT family N-acetyltransferase [Pseudarthrobacter sp. J64]